MRGRYEFETLVVQGRILSGRSDQLVEPLSSLDLTILVVVLVALEYRRCTSVPNRSLGDVNLSLGTTQAWNLFWFLYPERCASTVS